MKASSVGHFHQWLETNYPQQGDGVLILRQGRDKPTYLAVHVRGHNLGHVREHEVGSYVQLTYKIASYERKGDDGRKYWVTMLWFADMISADK